MQLSQKGMLLGLLALSAAPAAEAVSCKQAAVYTGLGAVGLTVGKFCFTDPEKFTPWEYIDNASTVQDKAYNATAYWVNEIAGHDKMDYEPLGWDGTKPLFKAKIKGRGWVYFMKKLWKPTENFLKAPALIAGALIALRHAPEMFKAHADAACGCVCNN